MIPPLHPDFWHNKTMQTRRALIFLLLVLLIGLDAWVLSALLASFARPAPTPNLAATLQRYRAATLTAFARLPAPDVLTLTPRPAPTPDPLAWQDWPILRRVSAAARQRYAAALAAGADPAAVSFIADCFGQPEIFLAPLVEQPDLLTADPALQQTAARFAPSLTRPGQAVIDGLNPSSALSPLWADPAACLPTEGPAACELRLHRPALVFILLGTNWDTPVDQTQYAADLRQLVTLVLDSGALPVLASKADNREGDGSVNLAHARLAAELDLPFWNFWQAAQALPNGGLDPDRGNIYLTPAGLELHRRAALQALDHLSRTLAP